MKTLQASMNTTTDAVENISPVLINNVQREGNARDNLSDTALFILCTRITFLKNDIEVDNNKWGVFLFIYRLYKQIFRFNIDHLNSFWEYNGICFMDFFICKTIHDQRRSLKYRPRPMVRICFWGAYQTKCTWKIVHNLVNARGIWYSFVFVTDTWLSFVEIRKDERQFYALIGVVTNSCKNGS